MKKEITKKHEYWFSFGDKVMYQKKQGIYIKNISSEYDYKSNMALVLMKDGREIRCYMSSISKGWFK